MKIVIPAENQDLESMVCPSFGRAPFFCIYNSENEKSEFVINTAADSQGGAGIKAAQIIVDLKADVLLTPRCGENAAKVIQIAKIEIFKSVNDSLKKNIETYMNNQLKTLTEFHAGFHGRHSK